MADVARGGVWMFMMKYLMTSVVREADLHRKPSLAQELTRACFALSMQLARWTRALHAELPCLTTTTTVGAAVSWWELQLFRVCHTRVFANTRDTLFSTGLQMV
jgi:hypothetical protein